MLRPFARDPRLDLHAMTEEYLRYGHRLEPHIADTARLCWEALDAGKHVIFEGAQATMLDLDHGTYPFVTSSNPVAGARLRRRRRRPDATSTRSGASPRPTPRASAPAPSRPSSTTSSASTCASSAARSAPRPGATAAVGWLDLVALRYAVRLNGMSALAITKLDVLAGTDPLKVAVRYRSSQGAVLNDFPWHQSILHTR